MKIAAIIIACILTFAGAGGLRLAMHSFDATPAAGGETQNRPGRQADAVISKTGKSGAAAENPAAGMAAAQALAGVKGQATVSADDVFDATGLTRRLRLGLFLTNAAPEDLKSFLDRCSREQIYDIKLTDPVYLRWTELDPQGAITESRSGGAAWWAWGKTDPAAALTAAAKDGPASLQAVARAIAQNDTEAGRRVLLEYPEADSRTVQEGLVDSLKRTDPAAAAALALEKGADLDDAVQHWMQQDQTAALAWAKNLPASAQRREVLRLAFKEMTLTDPAQALAETEKLPAGSLRADAAAEAIGALALRDPAAAQQAVNAMPPGAAREQALASLAVSLAGSETGKAAALEVLQRVSWKELSNSRGIQFKTGSEVNDGNSGHDGTSPVFTTVQQMMSVAPEETANMLSASPAEQEAPLKMAADIWVKQDPESASRWASALPQGPVKDQAIRAITGWLTSGGPEPDFEAAAVWSLAFSQENDRTSTLNNAFNQWKTADPEAARAAADRLELNDTLRAGVENILR